MLKTNAVPQPAPASLLAAAAVRTAAKACGFPLVGLARAQPLDPGPLERWLANGYDADMFWMRKRVAERMDPTKVLTDARTVIALGIPYLRAGGTDVRSPIARYARGRDYHYAHRDRLQALRTKLLELDPTLETYACVDTGVAMEKPWAERAGLGWIGKNGCLINTTYGSWTTLSVMFLDRAVDLYDEAHPHLCGDCTACLSACPTQAFPSPGVVDARKCVSYQTIENRDVVPLEIRPKLSGHVFGCDICQEICPFNRRDIPDGDARFEPRRLGLMTSEEIAGLSQDEFRELSTGTAMARAHFGGLRRNAILALGAARRKSARPLLERLVQDQDPMVREAAVWSLRRLGHET